MKDALGDYLWRRSGRASRLRPHGRAANRHGCERLSRAQGASDRRAAYGILTRIQMGCPRPVCPPRAAPSARLAAISWRRMLSALTCGRGHAAARENE